MNNLPKLRLKNDAQVQEYSPTLHLADENFIALAIQDCLKDNDYTTLLEILEAHLEAINIL